VIETPTTADSGRETPAVGFMCRSVEVRGVSTVSRIRSDPVGFGRTFVDAVQESDATFVAASLAYYAFVSLIPLLALVVVVATVVGGEALATEVVALVGDLLTPAAQTSLIDAFRSDTGRGGVGVVGLLLTTWGALKLFRGLDRAFGKVYGTVPGGIVEQVRDALLVSVSIGVGVGGVTVVGSVIAFLPIPGAGLVGSVSLLVALVVAFFPLYYVFPDAQVTPRQALPGTVFAAVCWTLLGVGFGLYATFAGSSAVYGLLGGILLLVTWFYLGGVVLLVGAVLNAVLAGWSFGDDSEGGDVDGGDARDRTTEPDRQVQHPSGRHDGTTAMSESPDGTDGDETSDRTEPRGAPDIGELEAEVERLRADLDDFERDVSDRTVEKPKLEAELKRYVRRRMRRGKARGWGPYLVLLYGTAMTIAGFVLLDDLLAMIAMIVIFLSTLGLYVLFVLFGISLNVLSVPGRARDWVGERRD
jgi:YihY family inner membrane protein